MTHICTSKLTTFGSDNGLSPGRRQAIIWTNAGILLIGPLGTNFSEILIKIYKFSFKKMQLKMSSGKWRPSRLGLNVLTNMDGFWHGFFPVKDMGKINWCKTTVKWKWKPIVWDILYHETIQAGKQKFFGTPPNWAVSYIAYTKFHLPRPVLHLPGHFFTHIGKRASASFPACYWFSSHLQGLKLQKWSNFQFDGYYLHMCIIAVVEMQF